jgi:hypothetical protein
MVAWIKLYPSYHCPHHSYHPEFSMQIVLGPKLGGGEFSNVFEVKSFVLRPDKDDTFNAEELQQRLRLKQQEKYHMTGKARYAMKHIKENYHREHDSEKYIQAAG